MRAWIENDILFINHEDLPQYKKGGGTVRNNYFWALKSIACQAGKRNNWEFDPPVWVALGRLLLFFTCSGYLGFSETTLEFPVDSLIPEELQSVSSRL